MDVNAAQLSVGDVLRSDIERLYQFYAERNKVHAGIVDLRLEPVHELVKVGGKHALLRYLVGVAAVDDKRLVEVIDVDPEQELVYFMGYDCDEPVEFFLSFDQVKYGMQYQ